MAVAWKSVGTLTSVTTSTTSTNFAFPASVANGDIAILTFWSTSGSPTMPTGFNSVATGVTGYYFAWKRCVGTEGGTNGAVTTGVSEGLAGNINLFSGCTNLGTPYEGFAVQTGTVASATFLVPSTTSTFVNTLGVRMGLIGTGASMTNGAAFTPLASHTERVDVSDVGTNAQFAMSVDTIAKAAKGITASGSWTTLAAANGFTYVSFGFALIPFIVSRKPKMISQAVGRASIW